MGKFADKKKEIFESSAPKEGEKRKVTDNKQQFNELATALMNDPDFEDVSYTVKKGELVEVKTTPVADLRKGLIGGIAKDAGMDAADADKLVENYEFKVLPWYPVVADMIEGYVESGKRFTFPRRSDVQGSLVMVDMPEETKNCTIPNAGGQTKPVTYGVHRKYKVRSSCPDELRKG